MCLCSSCWLPYRNHVSWVNDHWPSMSLVLLLESTHRTSSIAQQFRCKLIASSLPPSMKLPAAPCEVVQPQYKLSGQCQNSCQLTFAEIWSVKKKNYIWRGIKGLYLSLSHLCNPDHSTLPAKYVPCRWWPAILHGCYTSPWGKLRISDTSW